MRTDHQPIDLVKELRLRTWARRNHVPVAQREAAWHPVVLEEMEVRDAELAVQLIEAVVAVDEMEAAEVAKVTIVEKAVAAEKTVPAARPQSVVEPGWEPGQRVVSAFVPLLPAPYQRLDEPHASVPPPNLVGRPARESGNADLVHSRTESADWDRSATFDQLDT